MIRATHESEYRKLKNETKKLLEVVGNVKKVAANNSNKQLAEISKLNEEIAAFRDSKNLLEKKLRNCNCTSAGALKGAITKTNAISNDHTKVEMITATAKAEIQRLVKSRFSFNKLIFLIFSINLSLTIFCDGIFLKKIKFIILHREI